MASVFGKNSRGKSIYRGQTHVIYTYSQNSVAGVVAGVVAFAAAVQLDDAFALSNSKQDSDKEKSRAMSTKFNLCLIKEILETTHFSSTK